MNVKNLIMTIMSQTGELAIRAQLQVRMRTDGLHQQSYPLLVQLRVLMRTEGVTTMELSLFQAIELMLVTSRLRIRMRTEGVTMYTFLSKFHITKLSLPKCHFYVVTKLSLPTCHYQIVITELTLPKIRPSRHWVAKIGIRTQRLNSFKLNQQQTCLAAYQIQIQFFFY